jgi:hypothetical protein
VGEVIENAEDEDESANQKTILMTARIMRQPNGQEETIVFLMDRSNDEDTETQADQVTRQWSPRALAQQ